MGIEYRFEGAKVPVWKVWKHESWSYCSCGVCGVFDFQSLDPSLFEKGAFIFVTVVEAPAHVEVRNKRKRALRSTFLGQLLRERMAAMYGDELAKLMSPQKWSQSRKLKLTQKTSSDEENHRQFLSQQFFGSP